MWEIDVYMTSNYINLTNLHVGAILYNSYACEMHVSITVSSLIY